MAVKSQGHDKPPAGGDLTMNTSATAVRFDDNSMWADVSDGRTIGVPFAWFPRLLYATPELRERVEIGRMGLHWEELDEDVSIAGLLATELSFVTVNKSVTCAPGMIELATVGVKASSLRSAPLAGPLLTVKGSDNSDVSPVGDVAVAEIVYPAAVGRSRVALTFALPAASVVTSTPPMGSFAWVAPTEFVGVLKYST